MDVGELIRNIDDMREYQGMTVQELCKNAGIARNTYYSWLDGTIAPNLATLNVVLNVLNIELVPMYQEVMRAGSDDHAGGNEP